MIVLFGIFGRYRKEIHQDELSSIAAVSDISATYAMWVDIHTMIFVGFGFLMVFLKTHCWSSVGFNYLVAAWTVQCGVMFVSIAHGVMAPDGDMSHGIELDFGILVEGDFCAAACLITMGALLGKTTFSQLFILVTFESILYAVNAVLVLQVLKCHDIGGAMTIHMFGAYFGLAASYFFEPNKAIEDKAERNKGSYMTQMVAMIGTLFLFIYWPSFNAILAGGIDQHWAIVNTLLSISTSTIVGCSVAFLHLGKFEMEVMLNATLAGGVIMGAAADIIASNPAWVMLAGAIAGAISAAGYIWLNNLCKTKLRLHDTCGVHYLHAIPGVLGSITCCFAILHGESVFDEKEQQAHFPWHFGENGRSYGYQAFMNFIGILVTFGIAIASGALFGFLVGKMPMPEEQFDDTKNFVHVEFGDDTSKYNVSASTEAH
jgi:ammonium transporter Rh